MTKRGFVPDLVLCSPAARTRQTLAALLPRLGSRLQVLYEEGLYLGASSALNVVAAKEVAEKLGKGHTVVTVLCDGAYRYADRLFSKKWLTEKNLISAIPTSLSKYIVLP